jgi:hypothetical protein
MIHAFNLISYNYLGKIMLDIFKKDPPLNYIFTPYKPKVNLELINTEVIDQKIHQSNLNAIFFEEELIDLNK